MNPDEYKKLQMGGGTIKPIHYHIGEWIAINYLCSHLNKNSKILDIGCGIGYGVGMFNKLGFWDVLGIDLNPDKISMGKMFGYNIIEKDILDLDQSDFYNVIWSSHSFEHMLYPGKTLEHLLKITSYDAKFYFILPYPDLEPAPAHCAVKKIGTNVDDNADTVINWFKRGGLKNKILKFDSFREPEVWMEFSKK